MDWIQTFSGVKFRPADPRPVDFDIADIAHSLSLLCRFNGHCRGFYSVADNLREAPLQVRIEPWTAEEAARAFLARYRELYGGV